MNHKHQQNINHVSENLNLMVANVTEIKTGTMINADVCERIQEKMCATILYPATCSCQNGIYRKNIIDDSVITCDEIIEMTKSIMAKTVQTKSILTNFNGKKVIYKIKIFCILLAILSTTMTSIAVSIYCCIIKY